MNDFVKHAVYFLLGGTIVSVSAYLGSQGRSFLAAFASTFPAITGATFILIYLNGGNESLVGYAKHLLWFVPPWIVYVVAMIHGPLHGPLLRLRRADQTGNPITAKPPSLDQCLNHCWGIVTMLRFLGCATIYGKH